MAKRSVTFADLEGEGPEEEPPLPPRKRAMSRFPGQPSLDSDEEEEDEDEAEGSSDFNLFLPHGSGPSPAAAAEEGEGPLTPFDLGPELAEGRFDPHGHFLWDPAPPPDPWLEAIEGLPIKPLPPRRDVTASPPPSPPPLRQLLAEALELLRPRETVGGALRRLGGRGQGGKGRGQGGKGRSEGEKGRGEGGKGRGHRQATPPAPPELLRLVAVADGLVARGVLGALEEDREGLEGRMREEMGGEKGEFGGEKGEFGGGKGGFGGGNEEFGGGKGYGGEKGGFGGEKGGFEGEGKGGSPPIQGGSGAVDMFATGEEEEEEKGEGKEEGEVLWEYTWEEGGDIYGPFSSAQMQEWASQGYFQGGGARCRRVLPLPHPPGPFYDCARVDFELFT